MIDLNSGWKLLYRGLDMTADRAAEVMEANDFIDAGPLPCDVHMPLIRAGVIKDPVVADYCYASEWIEDKSWWFRRDFTLEAGDLAAREILLVLESLDLCADIFVNARHAGSHASCHYPFEADIRSLAREGVNTLLVRLTAGAEHVTEQQINYIKPYISAEIDAGRGGRGDKRRAFLRKPQYVYGWDWGPRIATIGIMKNAYILIHHDLSVSSIHPITISADAAAKTAEMRFEVEFVSHRPISTFEADVLLDMYYGDEKVLSLSKSVLAVSGVNFVEFEAIIGNARLWWPNGAGEQPLYTVNVTLNGPGRQYASKQIRTGLRTVALNLEKYGDNDRRFAVQINGADIFCKGGDWIPADSIYARVTPEKYRTLIAEARECNFNMLRIWGGGIYERDEFYDLCDEYGILIWHDFMFACSLYPDDQEWFRAEAAKEIDYQTKRLRRHPCMALWCGNNENQWIYEGLFKDGVNPPCTGGLRVYNHIAPSIVRNNCPEIPYWRSSPYGGELPNSNEVGDRHHWQDCTMNEDMAKRITPEEYDKVTSKFVTEYGYIGPCSDETIQKYYGCNPVVRNDRIWNLHNNTFEKATVPEGIRKHYADPDKLDLKDYLHYARLVQGLMYAYSLESIRFYEHCAGSLFWMYNDTWGEVGWTIIDYYLDRKPSYYYVKRAFSPVKLILRASAGGKTVRVMGVNDTPNPAALDMEYGYAGFDGKYNSSRTDITLAPFTKGIVFEFPLPEEDLGKGVVFARAEGAPAALLRAGDFKDYQLAGSELSVEKIEVRGNDYAVTIKSAGYAHAVSFGLKANIRLSDEYFDMLPGEIRTVTIFNAADKVGADEIKPAPVRLQKP